MFILSQDAVVHEHAVEAVADGLFQQYGRNRRIDPAGETE